MNTITSQETLAVIERQRAELKRLSEEVIPALARHERAEATKAFAKRLVDKAKLVETSSSDCIYMVDLWDIVDTSKEMLEED